jgi:hypothetical protein
MQDKELFFVIPTHRLRDVGDTIEHYDEHFWRNGHAVRMLVFDDSSPANQEKYYPLLEQTRTHHDVYYVGPGEKEQFLAYLNGRLRDKRLESLVKVLVIQLDGNFASVMATGDRWLSQPEGEDPW